MENISLKKAKISLTTLLVLAIFFLYNFFLSTPYQYTYLNSFNGDITNGSKKFENDYWGASIRELVSKASFVKGKNVKISTCGINPKIAENYFNKKSNTKVDFVRLEEAEYIIMTNRTMLNNNTQRISNCFDVFNGEKIIKVIRNGLVLSAISLIK